MTTEIHIHGPVTFITDKETPAKTPSAPPRPVPKPPTDNGGRLISRGGSPLPAASAAKCDSGPKARWRVWPKECPKDQEDILIRFERLGALRYFVAWTECGTCFVAHGGFDIFQEESEDDGFTEFIYAGRKPDEIQWIPLAELLKGVA